MKERIVIIRNDDDRYDFIHSQPFVKSGHWTDPTRNLVVRFLGVDLRMGGYDFIMINDIGLCKRGLIRQTYLKEFIKTEESFGTKFLDDADMGILEVKKEA